MYRKGSCWAERENRVWGSSICGTEHSRGKNKTEKDRMHRNLHRGPLMSLAEYKPEHVNTWDSTEPSKE